MIDRDFFSVSETAEYLTAALGEQFSESDVIAQATAGKLPVCAYRHFNDSLVYLAPDDVSQFDPVKNVANLKVTLMLGFDDPVSALSGESASFTEASGWETVESLEKLLIPSGYVADFVENKLAADAEYKEQKYGARQSTQDEWEILEEIYISQSKKFPKASNTKLSRLTQRIAENSKNIVKASETIRKKMPKILSS